MEDEAPYLVNKPAGWDAAGWEAAEKQEIISKALQLALNRRKAQYESYVRGDTATAITHDREAQIMEKVARWIAENN